MGITLKSKEDLAFEEADGIASEAFIKICKVFAKHGYSEATQGDWARTSMERWS